mmetsp:Transcript_2168/g.3343  ORF Transcript_2168/g.3343 Transcript_2168/m.3343 type:complete len:285 (+) Transcript_2168:447-1301(+)|eukprot:CAMPEP_0197476796 /NCGR_PEP_ID=MMETSP1309-20131121/10409_1 /TAXON_ID=464262 /ORGANISM="Genus nov. species nov., Strain RCC998" /LENGTH=284 /DNA_ID=CAMNT_0043017337 /DNA_START=368 /DNA_END=1222 /DNA_ORIENTATION=+
MVHRNSFVASNKALGLLLGLLLLSSTLSAVPAKAEDQAPAAEVELTPEEKEQEELNKKFNEQVEKDIKGGNIELYAYFPGNQDLKFAVGELHTVVAGARVQEALYGKFSCNGLRASINSPYDAGMVIQNFTYTEPFNTVMQGKDKSLHLKMSPDEQLQERKFQLIVYVLCRYLPEAPESPADFNQGLAYYNVAFNETVEFIDTSSAIDFSFFMLLAIFGSMTFALLYIFTDIFSGLGSSGSAAQKKGKKPKAVETGTVEANGDEWLQGTNFAAGKSKTTRRKKK